MENPIYSDIAERIYKELLHEQVSIWYISDEFGSKVMVKAMTASIKSVINGCKIELIFGRDRQPQPNAFHTGIRIYDDNVHYLTITGIQRFVDEHTSLEKIMNRSSTQIHFHNELNICVATAALTIDTKEQMAVLNFLGNVNSLYIGPFNENASSSLDCFEYSLGMERTFTNVHKIDTLIVPCVLSEWRIMENSFIGVSETNKIIINDPNEGGNFEQQIWASLEKLFEFQVFKNPKIAHKKGTRELTDIFAFSDYGIFLIETKALGIFNVQTERSMDRKVKGLQQQIEKGINQLIGAAKKLKEQQVFDEKGSEIFFDKTLLPHCIVLVSELLPFGEWEDILKKVLTAMIENPFYLHIMDFRELMQFIGHSQGNKDKFDYLLVQRIQNFIREPEILTRAKFVTKDKE